MSSIYEKLENAVRDVSLLANKNHPDTPVIFSHQNGSEPPQTFISVNLLRVEQQGKSSIAGRLNRDDTLDVRVVYDALVQISFLGDEAGKIAHDFLHYFNSPETLEAMSKHKVALLRKTSLRRNPQRRDTRWVESFNFDATFNYIVNTPELITPVEHIVIDESYADDIRVIPPFPITP